MLVIISVIISATLANIRHLIDYFGTEFLNAVNSTRR